MIDVSFMCIDPRRGEAVEIRKATLPAIPRIGDKVRFVGQEFGDDSYGTWDDKELGCKSGMSNFEVFDVVWDDPDESGVSIEVYVGPPPSDSGFEPFCGCSKEQRDKWKPGDDGRCENCGRKRRDSARGE